MYLVSGDDSGILDFPSEDNKVVQWTEKVHTDVINLYKGVSHNHHLCV